MQKRTAHPLILWIKFFKKTDNNQQIVDKSVYTVDNVDKNGV